MARFDNQDEDNQVLDETELFIFLNVNQKLTETDLHNIDIASPLEHQIQQQEMKYSCWRFDKFNSMTVYCYKTGEMVGRSHIKNPLRSNAILNIEKINKYFFYGQFWPFYILVIIIILTEFQYIDKSSIK